MSVVSTRLGGFVRLQWIPARKITVMIRRHVLLLEEQELTVGRVQPGLQEMAKNVMVCVLYFCFNIYLPYVS